MDTNRVFLPTFASLILSNMSFKSGDLIRFRYTGLGATIIEIYPGGSFRVRTHESPPDEIVAFAEDIIPAAEFQRIEESEAQKALQKQPKLSTEDLFFSKDEQRLRRLLEQGKQPPAPPAPSAKPSPKPEKAWEGRRFDYGRSSNQGLSLVLCQEQGAEQYTIYLVNDTPYSLDFRYRLLWPDAQAVEQSLHKPILSREFFALGGFKAGQLQEYLAIELELPVLARHFSKRLKNKDLIKSPHLVELLGFEVIGLWHLPPDFQEKQGEQPLNSLQAYTQDILKKRRVLEEEKAARQAKPKTILEQRGAFDPILDLHLEKLVDNPKEVKENQILGLQLEHFERFLQEAIRLGIKDLHVIHGLGAGKLKEEIARRLERHPKVWRFDNEYDHRFGFGATRIALS